MKFTVKNTEKDNIQTFMRKIGYTVFHNSFTRCLSRGHFPRFHVYLKEEDDDITIMMHLDQKKESYFGSPAHSGDYEDSPALDKEKERILSILNQ